MEQETETPEPLPQVQDGKVAAAQVEHKRPDEAQIVGAIGLRGTGKTTFLRHYSARQEPRRLALDPFGDFTGGYTTFKEDWREGLEWLKREPRALSVRLALPLSTDSIEWGDSIFNSLLSINPEQFAWDLLLILDEVHRYGAERESRPLLQLILQARRLGIRVAYGSQRMVYVPRVIMNETTDLAVFRIRSPTDRKRLDEWTVEGAGDEAAHLEDRTCLLWSPL